MPVPNPRRIRCSPDEAEGLMDKASPESHPGSLAFPLLRAIAMEAIAACDPARAVERAIWAGTERLVLCDHTVRLLVSRGRSPLAVHNVRREVVPAPLARHLGCADRIDQYGAQALVGREGGSPGAGRAARRQPDDSDRVRCRPGGFRGCGLRTI